MVIIRAPHPGHRTTLVLPSPSFEDSRAPQAEVLVKRSMLGRMITYVKSSSRETIRLPFEVTRYRAAAIESFFRVYYRAPLQITLQDNSVYVGNLVSPISQTGIGRKISGLEMVSITLEFSVEKQ